jgi:PD-(D/E)XK nuclease superfamily
MTLTPVQERALRDLMAGDGRDRPVFPPELAGRLRVELEARLAPAVAALREGEQLWVTKHRLAELHSRCEGLFLAHHLGEGEFGFSTRLAVGMLVHRAVQVGVYRKQLDEADLVEAALSQLVRDDTRFADFVASLDQADRAEVEAEAIRQTLLFRATFPPFEPSWTPAVEVPLSAEVAEGRIVLRARPDIMLGSTDPDDPMRARRLLLELKTGADIPEHDEDLRFYALVATLRFGVPPFRVATVHLERGTWRAYDVNEDLLRSAVRRTGDAYVRAAALFGGEEPRLRAGVWCGWCPRGLTCPASALRATGD